LVSALVATTLQARSSLLFVTLVMAAHGVGFGFFSAPNMTVIMRSVSADATSMASALGAKARYLGMLAGMLVTEVLIAVHIGSDPVELHPIRFIGIMVTAFSMLTVLTAVALGVCFLTRTRRRVNAANIVSRGAGCCSRPRRIGCIVRARRRGCTTHAVDPSIRCSPEFGSLRRGRYPHQSCRTPGPTGL
jgi:hypothetical protein